MNAGSAFDGQAYLNLETRRASGEPVCTPLWFVQDGEVFYFRTLGTSGKVKRMRANPRVRIAPCRVDGALLGDWHAAEWIALENGLEAELLARYNEKYAADIAAITSREMNNKLRANQGYAVRLLPEE
ncbi:MAG: pyridoxamine 5'-phosphate oxidase family protein [Anaerolineae bacterium]|nr:pyridoxamine 5'-phosphate oxidase family protein [Anaerolineae bacterium]